MQSFKVGQVCLLQFAVLSRDQQRFSMFPIKLRKVWDMYKRAEASFWVAEEVDLRQDRYDWCVLTSNERHFLKHVFAFFASSDGIVIENLGVRFLREVQIPEVRAFYGFQVAMENIHSEMYSILLQTFITDPAERLNLFLSIKTVPCVKKKAQWALQWVTSSESFSVRLLAFACVEGVFFSGSFCAIFWLKKRGLMPGLTFSNELISRDEGMHTDFACLLFREVLQNRISEGGVLCIISRSVEIELEFVCDALPVDCIGMNSIMMSDYIRFVADRLLISLGYNRIYQIKNPFQFMELISLQGKTNFFERRVGEYKKAGVQNFYNARDMAFSLYADF
jgi:ribonucleoside-diphosphate reductase subunit M2